MMLEFKNVSFRYAVDEFPMMENLSFSVEEGDFVSIIGASGCGKSTIFRLINGLEQLQKGEIPSASRSNTVHLCRRRICFFHGGRLRKISVCRWSWQVCLRRNRRSGAGMC